MKTYLQKKTTDGDSIFDAINDFFKPMFYDEHLDSMKTDIKETAESYQLDIEMPGFSKNEIKVSLDNGYLTVSAEKTKQSEKPENESEGRYLRKECSVSCQRSYYVGDDVERENIKAKYENGMLLLCIPKVLPKKEAPHTIEIE
ncbi:MAG: Hsp20/alpha crystallin family protein [Candidatus Gallimonas sp.]